MCKLPVIGEITLEKAKTIFWILGIIFGVCIFIQKVIGHEPRIKDLEDRMKNCEDNAKEEKLKFSMLEIKFDTLLSKQDEMGKGLNEMGKDVKDIYHLIMDRHK